MHVLSEVDEIPEWNRGEGKFCATDKWIFPLPWIRFPEEEEEDGMQRWLPWPTFLHSPANSSSWEHWRYSIWREFSHAWPVTTRQQRNGCTQGASGGGESVSTLTVHKEGTRAKMVQSFLVSIFTLSIYSHSTASRVCVFAAWLNWDPADVSVVWIPERRCRYGEVDWHISTLFSYFPSHSFSLHLSYPQAPVSDWATPGIHP